MGRMKLSQKNEMENNPFMFETTNQVMCAVSYSHSKNYSNHTLRYYSYISQWG